MHFIRVEYIPISEGSTGIIAPIFKKGNSEDTNNYRGITLTNIVAKIYSNDLNNRLIKWSKNMEN